MEQVSILYQDCTWQVTGISIERILLVALKDGIIIGSSAIRRDMRSKEDLYLESTFVNEDYRRSGVATLLNEKSIAIAEQLKVKRLSAIIYRGNKFYLRWFLKRGFKIHSKDDAKDTVQIFYEPKLS